MNPQATFKVGFAESLPPPDESADIVVSSLSFHHWENHQKGIHEIAAYCVQRDYCALLITTCYSQSCGERKSRAVKRFKRLWLKQAYSSAKSKIRIEIRPYHIGAKMRSECLYPVIKSCKKLLQGRKILLNKEKFVALPML